METKKPDSSRMPKSGRIKFYIFNCLLDRGTPYHVCAFIFPMNEGRSVLKKPKTDRWKQKH